MRPPRFLPNISVFLVCLLGALLITGCGKKTNPLPPDTVLPAPIGNLSYRLDEKGVTLTWTMPTRTVEGESLPYRIESFELFRAVIPAKEYCEGCPVPFGPSISIEGDPGAKGKISYRETLLRPRNRYIYKVRTRAGWFVNSDDSNLVSFIWDTPLEAPENLRATPGDRQVTISWDPPQTLLDGNPITSPLYYELYRSKDGIDFRMLESTLEQAEYVDRKVQNDTRYYYHLRAFRYLDDTRAAGRASEVASVVPVDRVAPASPMGVALFQAEAGLRILWEPKAERDLAGFRVYRRAEEMDSPVLIGEVPGGTPGFVDPNPPGQGIWYYSVSAFDRTRPPNESRRSDEVKYVPPQK
jgi:hypothetical protein